MLVSRLVPSKLVVHHARVQQCALIVITVIVRVVVVMCGAVESAGRLRVRRVVLGGGGQLVRA